MRMRTLIPVVFLLLTATMLLAQTGVVPQTPATAIKGRVLDASGAAMTAVNVKVYQGETLLKETITDATGDFTVPIEAGEYRVEVSAPDFETYNEVVLVTPNLGPLAITMDLALVTENIEVQAEAGTEHRFEQQPDGHRTRRGFDRAITG
jgi:hydrogenase maturation factor HypF (carbamoyltransferase family)